MPDLHLPRGAQRSSRRGARLFARGAQSESGACPPASSSEIGVRRAGATARKAHVPMSAMRPATRPKRQNSVPTPLGSPVSGSRPQASARSFSASLSRPSADALAAAAHSAQLNDLEEGASGVRAAGAAAAQEAAARVAALREKEKAAKRFEAVRFAGEEATLQSRLEQLTQRRIEKNEAADGKSLLFQAKLEKTIGATARSGALGLLSGAEALAQALFEKKGEAKGDDEE